MQATPEHGLTARHLGIIRDILSPYASHIVRVDLFGSRATGKYADNSDIDLVLHGDFDSKTVDRLWTLFHESSLPYKVDVQAYNLIKRQSLKKRMDEARLTLLYQQDLLRRRDRFETRSCNS